MTKNNQELVELMERLNYRYHKDGYWIREAYVLEPSHSNRIYDEDAQKILKEVKKAELRGRLDEQENSVISGEVKFYPDGLAGTPELTQEERIEQIKDKLNELEPEVEREEE